jgi:sugar phosphate isomerase/epimerase
MAGAPLLWAARGAAIGVQLESVRAQLKRSPDPTLRNLSETGFKDVEGYNRADTLALVPKLKQFGLTARSCQVEVPLITGNWDPYPQFQPVPITVAIEGVAEAGIQYFTMSAIGNGARGDGDDFYRRTADRMNEAGELCRKAKIRFAWQMHALDFAGHPRAIDIYRERLDLKVAPMELDVMQAMVAHQDAARILQEWKGHVPLVRVTGESAGIAWPGVECVFIGADIAAADPLASLRSAYNSMGSR